MIIPDLDYKTAISRLIEIGYNETSSVNAILETAEGVYINVLWQDRKKGIVGQYSGFDEILKNKPEDLLVADLREGIWKFLTLNPIPKKEEQEPEGPYGCNCCD